MMEEIKLPCYCITPVVLENKCKLCGGFREDKKKRLGFQHIAKKKEE